MFRLLKTAVKHLANDENFWLGIHNAAWIDLKTMKPHTKWDEYEADFKMYDEFAKKRYQGRSR